MENEEIKSVVEEKNERVYDLSDSDISKLICDIKTLKQMNEELSIKKSMFEEMAFKYKVDSENLKLQCEHYEKNAMESTQTIINLVNENQVLKTKLDEKIECEESVIE